MFFILPARQHSKGFTLIELLTVIAIIAVLMSLLFSAIGGVKDAARKVQAKNDCVQLVTATKAYYTEYGKYPMNDRQTGANWDTCYGDPKGLYSSADLCNILRAIPDNGYNADNQLNPRQVVFLDGNLAKDPNNPRNGLAPQDVNGGIKKGAFMDPWGNEYVVFVDGDYDNNLKTALEWFYFTETPQVTSGAAAVSLGKDGAWGAKGNGKFNGSDDVATWY